MVHPERSHLQNAVLNPKLTRASLCLSQYIPLPASHILSARQSATTSTASCSGVTNGGVAGIVLGTFFGTLLLVYFIDSIRTASQQGNAGYVVEERRGTRRKSRSSYSGGGRRSSRAEVREVSVRRPSRAYTTSS
jgi:hypothetical protein